MASKWIIHAFNFSEQQASANALNSNQNMEPRLGTAHGLHCTSLSSRLLADGLS
jgi:hypothetical protein